MKNSYKIISNNMESGKYTVSVNKAIIETYVAIKFYYNCTERITKKTTTRVTTEKTSKITVI